MMQSITIRTGKEQMDIAVVHGFLSEHSYWAKGISYTYVERSMDHSYCVGAFAGDQQVGFGRVVTDYYTFAWLADFMVLPEYQGQGVAKQMLAHIFEQEWAGRLRRIMLGTRDAHGLYRQFNFKDPANPSFLLEIARPGIYLQGVTEPQNAS